MPCSLSHVPSALPFASVYVIPCSYSVIGNGCGLLLMTAGMVDPRRGGTECSRVVCVVLSGSNGMTERLAVSLLTGLHWSIRDVSAWSYHEGSIRQHGRVFCKSRNRLRNRKQQEGPTCCRQDRDRLPSHCRSSVRPKLFVPSCLQSQTFTSLPG